MTEAQFEKIKKGLNFHSEGGIYNLCTLTETALREIIEDAVKFYEKQQEIDALHIVELQKQNGELTDKVKELEAQIEKMKRHSNCKHRSEYNEFDPYSKVCQSCCNLEKWEFGEIKEK